MSATAGAPPGEDTIAAIATAPGRGAIGIVRLSGPGAAAIGAALCAGRVPPARRPVLRTFLAHDGTAIDRGLVLYLPGPASFTGEDVVELQGHGGPVVMQLLLRRVLELGARAALPGEFSRRAFLNDRLDLTQAEAIADLIASSTEAGARAALRSLEGALSECVAAFQRSLTELRVYIEAALDFPDEEIDFLADGEIARRTDALLGELDAVLRQAGRGRLLRDGLQIALVGKPNAGKSSLLNALTGREAAIVTAIPGTTRDVLREQIHLDGIPVHLVDTAGLRPTGDVVEAEGVRRAERELEHADLVLLVVDDSQGPVDPAEAALGALAPAAAEGRLVIVRNKIDLTGAPPGPVQGRERPTLCVSATVGTGLDALRRALREVAGAEGALEGAFMARTRHVDALRRTRAAVAAALARLVADAAGELAAEELRLAQRHLSELTGEVTSDDLLGAIFASFCIGK